IPSKESPWPDEREREEAVEAAPHAHVVREDNGNAGGSPWALLRRALDLLLQWNNRHHVKHVQASPHVLRTYHTSHLYGNLPVSGRFRTFIRCGNIRYVWYVVELNLAVLSGILYVYSTYYVNTALYMKNIQDFISLVFFFDYVLHVFCEPATLHYVFSVRGIVELLSFVPLVFLFDGPGKGSRFIHLLQLLRIVRIFSCLGEIGIVGSTATQQIILLVVATVGVVFLDAGILQWLENGFSAESKSSSSSLTYWQSFYFLIVTVATVGYGDVVPTTTAGQVLAVLSIIGTVVILPSQIGKISSVASRRPYGQSFSAWRIVDSRFVIISGSVKLRIIHEFLSDLFNPSHYEDLEVYPLCVVIMGPFRPSYELKETLSLYGDNVAFMEGSPLCQSDLERANATKASAFFLLADADAKDAKIEDAAQIVRALAVQRYCLGNVRIIVEVLDPATQSSTVWDSYYKSCMEVICPSKVHFKILSRSCHIKGLYAFIANMFTSGIRMRQTSLSHFLSEYCYSFSQSVYPVILPSIFCGLLFEEVVEFVYSAFNVVLFGLDIPVDDDQTQEVCRTVVLFPRGHFVDKDDIGLVLACDLQTVHSISKLTQEDMGKYSKRWTFSKFSKRKAERTEDKMKLLQHVCSKWTYQKSRASISKEINLEATELDIELTERAEPSSPHGHGKLKKHLFNVIYTGLVEQGGRKNASEAGYLNDFHQLTQSKDDGRSPDSRKGWSIQLGAEELLAWPPSLQYGRPHPAVLTRKTDLILQNLQKRTISFVDLAKPHVLVCCQGCWPTHMYYLLAGLRMPPFPMPPVVILHPQEPSAFHWGSVGIFEDVFFLQGAPLYEVDLLRGGILQAEKVVVLGDQGVLVDITPGRIEAAGETIKFSSAYTSDIDNIVIVANIEQILGKRANNVIVEMQHISALHYVQPQYSIPREIFSVKDYKRNPNGLVHYTPPFMEGKAVSGSMLGFLLRFTFYNKNTRSIIEQLVDGGPTKLYDGLSNDHRRIMDQISVPDEYVNRPFSELFIGLLTHQKMLALGLYRASGTLGAPTPYVYTNPPRDAIVNAVDLVFVLK
ncbi:hypothetical protein GOP47_0024465, partial [Adiantum capillus-veneris]